MFLGHAGRFSGQTDTQTDTHTPRFEAGGQRFPRDPMSMNYGQGQYTRPFMQLYDVLGIDENKGSAISMGEFSNHLCLYAFDLTPEEQDSSHWELLRTGTTTVHC